MLVLGLILLTCVTHIRSESECVTKHHGRCQDIFAHCAAGHMETLDYCGPLEMCCYPASNSHHTVETTTASNLPSTRPVILKNDTCGDPRITSDHRVVGGSVTNHGAYPWQVALTHRGFFTCGATLISDQWIVSAAHCFAGGSLDDWRVGVGMQDLHASEGQWFTPSDIIVHEDYNSKIMMNDITLIKLPKAVDIHGLYVRPLCLPKKGESFDNLVCTATGWGSTESGGNVVTKLREVDLAIVPNDQCELFLPGDVLSVNVCAGYDVGDRDTCQGDSGGPLACPTSEGWKLAGITSWGYGCADKKSPGLYTRVESYLDWIHYVIAKHP